MSFLAISRKKLRSPEGSLVFSDPDGDPSRSGTHVFDTVGSFARGLLRPGVADAGLIGAPR